MKNIIPNINDPVSTRYFKTFGLMLFVMIPVTAFYIGILTIDLWVNSFIYYLGRVCVIGGFLALATFGFSIAISRMKNNGVSSMSKPEL